MYPVRVSTNLAMIDNLARLVAPVRLEMRFVMPCSRPPRLKLVSSGVPQIVSTVLKGRDWKAIIGMLEDGFPVNASWGAGGSFFERFVFAASVPAPPVLGSHEQALQEKVVQAFLSAGLSPHANTGSHLPLSVAALMGRPDFVRLLLDGAHAPDGLGGRILTPLGALAMRKRAGLDSMGITSARHDACIRELLQGGADINFPSSGGWVPLTIASSLGDHDMVQFLLDHGALINARAPGIPSGPGPHYAPVCWAVHRDDPRLMEILLEAGAALTAPMEKGLNVIAMAGARSGTDILRLLAARRGWTACPCVRPGSKPLPTIAVSRSYGSWPPALLRPESMKKGGLLWILHVSTRHLGSFRCFVPPEPTPIALPWMD